MQADKLKQAQEALKRLTPEERQKLANGLVKLARRKKKRAQKASKKG